MGAHPTPWEHGDHFDHELVELKNKTAGSAAAPVFRFISTTSTAGEGTLSAADDDAAVGITIESLDPGTPDSPAGMYDDYAADALMRVLIWSTKPVLVETDDSTADLGQYFKTAANGKVTAWVRGSDGSVAQVLRAIELRTVDSVKYVRGYMLTFTGGDR